MTEAVKGLLRGHIITLEAEVPELDGKRVLVLLEPANEAQTPEEVRRHVWQEWVDRGPQGVIEDEPGDPEFPACQPRRHPVVPLRRAR